MLINPSNIFLAPMYEYTGKKQSPSDFILDWSSIRWDRATSNWALIFDKFNLKYQHASGRFRGACISFELTEQPGLRTWLIQFTVIQEYLGSHWLRFCTLAYSGGCACRCSSLQMELSNYILPSSACPGWARGYISPSCRSRRPWLRITLLLPDMKDEIDLEIVSWQGEWVRACLHMPASLIVLL